MASQTAGSAASGQFGAVGQQMIGQGMNRPPTIEIRPGYQFNVMVTEDLVFPGGLQRLNVHKSYTERMRDCARNVHKTDSRRRAMGVLKRKEEPSETITLRVPASVKAEIDRLRERTSEAGFDLNATSAIDHPPDATDARRDGWVGREDRGERPFSKACNSERTGTFRSEAARRRC